MPWWVGLNLICLGMLIGWPIGELLGQSRAHRACREHAIAAVSHAFNRGAQGERDRPVL